MRIAVPFLALCLLAACDKGDAKAVEGTKAVGGAAGALTPKIQAKTEAKVEVEATDVQRVDSSRDAASGLPTGKRQHKPFAVTKPAG